ncbi:MAG: hypothetical protein RLZZ579_869, partial [Actinomycetota bacterium]
QHLGTLFPQLPDQFPAKRAGGTTNQKSLT